MKTCQGNSLYPIQCCMNNYIMIAIIVKTFYFQQLIASDVTRTQYCYFIWQIFLYIYPNKSSTALVLNLQHNILQLTKIKPRLMVKKKINTQGWKVKKKRVVFYSSDLYFKNIYTCSYIYRFCFVILNTFKKIQPTETLFPF